MFFLIEQVIRVYDKENDNLIAIFTKDPPANTIDSMEMLIDPEVTITQNGESIFKFQINIFSFKWKEINDKDYYFVVNNRKYTSLVEKPYIYDYDTKKISVELHETWIELDSSYIGAYNVDPKIEFPDIHSVILLPKSDKPLIINNVKYDNNPYPIGSAGYNVWAILQGSGWELAYCDVMVDGFNPNEDFGAFNIESDNKSRLYNLNMIRGLYGGVFKWDSMNSKLYYFDESKSDSEFNKWKGYEVREGKNITKVTKTIDKAIVTKLEPLGYDGLNIKDVNGGIEYITNYDYTTRDFHKILENKDLYDPNQLLFWGKRELGIRSKPRTLYNVKFQDFRMLDAYALEEFDISDVVKIIIYDENQDEIIDFQRIISWNYKVFSLDNSNMECGDKLRDYVELLKQAYNKTDYNANNNLPDSNITHGKTTLPNYISGLEYQIGYNTDNIALHENEIALNAQKITLTVEHIDDVSHALAQFKMEANSKYATIESLTYFKNDIITEVDGLKTEITTTASTLIQQISDAQQAAINMSTDFTKQEIQSLNGELISKINSTANTLIQQISTAEQAAITMSTDYTRQEINYLNGQIQNQIATTSSTLIQQISNAEQAAITASTDYTKQEIQNLDGQLQSQINITSNTLIQQISNAQQAAITSSTNYTNQQISVVDGKITTAQTTANTAINQISNANQAIISLEANYTTMSSSISSLTSNQASIRATADAAGASVALIVSNYTTASRAINAASIVTSVNNSGSQVLINANKIVLTAYSTTTQMNSAITAGINGINLTVSNGSTSSTLNILSGSTTLSSATITFTGIVTFANLSTSGQTTINGNNITTGTIDASRINLTAYSTTTQVTSSINSTIDGMNFTVSNGASSSTLTLRRGSTNINSATISFTGVVTFSDLSTNGRTTINGANITTGTISADRIDVSTLRFQTLYAGTTASSKVAVTADATNIYIGGNSLSAAFSNVYIYAGTTLYFRSWSSSSYGFRMDNLGTTTCSFTTIGSSGSLGTSSTPWSYGYIRDLQVTGTANIGTSSGRVGFFGKAPTTQISMTTLSTSADLSTVISKVNEFINDMKTYGLYK